MKWYENQVFIGTLALTIVACFVIYKSTLSSEAVEKIVIPIVTGISGFISGVGARMVRNQGKKEELDANTENKVA